MLNLDEKRKIVDRFTDNLPESPPADGIMLVDKPSGPTSHDIVYALRRKYGIKKIGHTGTLDPLASGLMILLLGKATKRAKEFEGLDKRYQVKAILGQERDTYDSEGQIIAQADKKQIRSITLQRINETLGSFRGEFEQTVPPYSAVKISGKPLYKYAREGKLTAVQYLPKRRVQVFELSLLNYEQQTDARPAWLELHLHCSKGFYVRSLIHDLGLALGCFAYVSALRRTGVGDYLLN